MAKRKSFEEKNKFIHPTRKKIIDTVFGRQDTNTHAFGYEGAVEKKKKVGEIWTDKDGNTWEQKEGYRSSVTQFDDVRKYLTETKECSTKNCETIKYTSADKKFISKTGLCLECLTKAEHALRLDGSFKFYEDYRITCNKLDYIKDVRQKYDDALSAVKQTFENVQEDGSVEKWNWDVDIKQVKRDIKKDMKNAETATKLLIERKQALEDKLIELNHPELIRNK